MASNSAIPVFVNDSGTAAEYGGNGAVLDLSERIKELDPNLYTSALFTAGRDANGKIWGVPHVLNPIAIIYNKEIFDKYGVDYPEEDWTWEDMFDIARKLTIKDANGKTEIYGFLQGTNITQGWLPYILANGGTPIDATRTKSNISDPKVREAFEKFKIPYKEGFAPDPTWVSSQGSMELAFANGKVAMMIAQISNLLTINNNAPDGFDYDAQMMPIGWDGNRYCVYVPNLLQIASRADKAVQDAAWEWIKYYLSIDAQMVVAQKGRGGFPIAKQALAYYDTAQTFPKNMKAFYKGIDEFGETLFENPCWFSWEQEVETRIGHIINNTKDFDALLIEMDAAVQEALDDYYND